MHVYSIHHASPLELSCPSGVSGSFSDHPRSRSSTGRSRANPMGNTDYPSTRLGNLLAARTLILLWLCAAKSIWYIVEQPSSSLMQYHDLFQRFAKAIPMLRFSMKMCDYGAATAKPTFLYTGPLISILMFGVF